MKSSGVCGQARLVGLAALLISGSALYAQQASTGSAQAVTPAELCTLLRENYTSFEQCHSIAQAQMCAMGQLVNQDPTQARRFDAIMRESNPDKTIRLVNDFVRQYPTSTMLSYAYSFAANAYQQKGEAERIAEYANRSLKLEPDNLMSLILFVQVLPLPQYIRQHPAERGKILRQALEEGDHALELITQIPRQPKEVEADYQKRRAAVASEVHGALGMVHMELAAEAPGRLDRAELAKAEQEFQTAVATARQPDPHDYYRMGEAYRAEGKRDEAIQAFTNAGKLGRAP